MINSNRAGSYCLSKKSHVDHITSSLLQRVLKLNVRLQNERKRVDADATGQEHIQ